MGLDAIAILHRTRHPIRKGGDIAFAFLILQHLSPVLRNDAPNINIYNLSPLEACMGVYLVRQGVSINGQLLNLIHIIELLQCRADMTLLTTTFQSFALADSFTVRVK